MSENAEPVTELSADECRDRLAGGRLGRLVTRVGKVLDIFPVNYVLDGDDIVFRTAEGSKLFELTVNDEVLFEVDEYTDTDAWSVVVRGKAERIEGEEEIAHADALPLTPWVPTMKRHYVRVRPESVSGRAFARGEEPDRFGIQQY